MEYINLIKIEIDTRTIIRNARTVGICSLEIGIIYFAVVVVRIGLLKVLGLCVAILAVLNDVVNVHQHVGDALLLVEVQRRESHQTKVFDQTTNRLGQLAVFGAPRRIVGHFAEQSVRIRLQVSTQRADII